MKAIAAVIACATLLVASPASAQTRWIEMTSSGNAATGIYQQVEWDSVAAIVEDRRAGRAGLTVYVVSDGKVRRAGRVPPSTASYAAVERLLASGATRWVTGWPLLDGAYQRPTAAVGYADLRYAQGIAPEADAMEAGGPMRVIIFEDDAPRIGAVGQAERRKVQAAIDRSVRPK